MGPRPMLTSVSIKGYRPFKDFRADLGPLEVIVGANGSGKSALFEFLRVLRNAMEDELPPGILPGYVGQRVFHTPGPDELSWEVNVQAKHETPLSYRGEVAGPVGQVRVVRDWVQERDGENPFVFLGLEPDTRRIRIREPADTTIRGGPAGLLDVDLGPARTVRQLGLSQARLSDQPTTCRLREHFSGFRFYSSFDIASGDIRRPAVIEQEPVLREDAGNLSAFLHYLMTEHKGIFDELQVHLGSAVPGFKGLTVKVRGGPGEVIAFWQEAGPDGDLTLADVSDGVLRLICWMVLCLQPNPPSLICIDEPELGVHPTALPIVAALLDAASDKTQIIVATHDSYFLTHFDIGQIAVMRKENGAAGFAKPGDSGALTAMLEDFGPEEVEVLHRSGELEFLA